MAKSTTAGLPDSQNTVVATLVNGTMTVTRGLIKRGVMYRVTPTIDCWLSIESAASANTGVYLPAKVTNHFVFGAQLDTSATKGDVGIQLSIAAGAAGFCHFTPIWPVPTNY
jgi:hypothetical protein